MGLIPDNKFNNQSAHRNEPYTTEYYMGLSPYLEFYIENCFQL